MSISRDKKGRFKPYIPRGSRPSCPKCGSEKTWSVKVWFWRCGDCHYEWQKTIKKGTTLEILHLCLRYRRCKLCFRVTPRPRRFGMNACGFCRTTPVAIDRRYIAWFKSEGYKLDRILPPFIPEEGKIRNFIRLWEEGKLDA